MTDKVLFWGDSHTHDGYASLVAAAMPLRTATNIAQPGHALPDQCHLPWGGPSGSGVFSHLLSENDVVFATIGTNDNSAYGESPPRQQIFADGVAAVAVYHAAKVKKAVDHAYNPAQWSTACPYGIGIDSLSVGAALPRTFTGDVLYVAYIRVSREPGSFSVSEGGTVKGGPYTTDAAAVTKIQYDANPTPDANGKYFYDFGPRLLRIAGFGPGEHTVSINVLSGKVRLIYTADATPNAMVFLGDLFPATAYPGAATALGVSQLNAVKQAMTAMLRGDGLNVHDFALTNYSSALLVDGLHLNVAGNQNLADAALAKYTEVLNLPPPPPPTYIDGYYRKRASDGVMVFCDLVTGLPI